MSRKYRQSKTGGLQKLFYIRTTNYHPMRGKIVLPIVLLISVAIVAGCVGQGTISIPGFGSDVVTPSRTTTSTGVTEPIAIENVRTLPEATVMPSQPVRLLMNIASKDTDPTKAIANVYIDLFDAHVFKSANDVLCNSQTKPCQPNMCSSSSVCTLYPSEIKPIEFSLKAPTVEEIANVITRATLNWLVRYDYATSTNYDVLVVSMEEILRLQQEGQTLAISVQDTRGPGPIKIGLSAEPTFVFPGQDIYITLKLEDMGSGFPLGRNITAGKLRLEFPPSLGQVSANPNDYFTCDGQGICTNSKNIEFFRKETTPLLFIVRTSELADAPHRAFTINAFMSYTYELRGSTSLEIRPQQFG
jgi:hypothetical protein